MDAVGGAHKFQGWRHNILTDSGGSVVLIWCSWRDVQVDGADRKV